MLQTVRFREIIVLWCTLLNVCQILVVESEQSWEHAPNVSGELQSVARRPARAIKSSS